jgi:hypothetical protein
MSLWWHMMLWSGWARIQVVKRKKYQSDISVMSGIQWAEVTLQDSEECYNMFRMRMSVFLRLHDTLVEDYGLKLSRKICTKEALGIFL